MGRLAHLLVRGWELRAGPLTMPPVALSDVRQMTSARAWAVLALAGAAHLFSAAPAAAGTFPGKNGKIAYNYLGTIYTISLGDGAGKQLVSHPDGGADASWSPRGERLVFVSVRGGKHDLYVIDADGSDERRLTSNDAIEEENPSWVDDDTVIFRADPDSGDPTFSTADLDAAPTSTYGFFRAAEPDVVDNFTEPEISAGGELLFTENYQVPGTSKFRSAAWTATGDGPATRFTGINPAYSAFSGGWSPDGDKFLYLGRTFVCCSLDVFVDSAAGTPVNVTNTPGRSEGYPRFSPDGTMQVYGDPLEGDNLYVSQADGSGEISLPTGFFDAREPDWHALGGATPPSDPGPGTDPGPGPAAGPGEAPPSAIRIRLILRDGSTVLLVVVPAAGRLRVAQVFGKAGASASARKNAKGKKGKKRKKRRRPLVKPVSLKPKKAGAVRVKIRPTKLGKKVLAKRGKLTVKVAVSFTPKGSKKTKSLTRKVTIRKAKRGKCKGNSNKCAKRRRR